MLIHKSVFDRHDYNGDIVVFSGYFNLKLKFNRFDGYAERRRFFLIIKESLALKTLELRIHL